VNSFSAVSWNPSIMGVGRSVRALTDHVVSGNLFLYTQFIILTYIVIRKLA